MQRAIRSRLVVAVLVAAFAAPLAAITVAGVNLADTAKVGDQTLVLNGTAVRTKYSFKVYAAGLYLAQRQTDAAAALAADAPRRMVMHFLRDVEKAKICEGWNEGLAANTPGASAELKGQFAQLCSWMPDATPATQIVFTYIPGTGTTVQAVGLTKGTIPGKAFSDALLAVWIGPKPGPGEAFKKGLLGN